MLQYIHPHLPAAGILASCVLGTLVPPEDDAGDGDWGLKLCTLLFLRGMYM